MPLHQQPINLPHRKIKQSSKSLHSIYGLTRNLGFHRSRFLLAPPSTGDQSQRRRLFVFLPLVSACLLYHRPLCGSSASASLGHLSIQAGIPGRCRATSPQEGARSPSLGTHCGTKSPSPLSSSTGITTMGQPMHTTNRGCRCATHKTRAGAAAGSAGARSKVRMENGHK